MRTVEGTKRSSAAVRSYWASMTHEQRSAEMHKRQMVAQRKRRARLAGNSSESPFPKELLETRTAVSPSIKQRLEALEAALAALRAEIGF